ncbi:antitoxin Xre/MbcA/ParS toxin-binding domain-containing protein [Caulobacter segnis]
MPRFSGFGLEVYGSPEKVREFLRRPHVMLDGKAPLDLAIVSSPGADPNVAGRPR